MSRWRVATGWRASYPDPIRLEPGEAVTLTGRADVWDGHRWLWAVAPDGRAGWVPDVLIAGDPPRVREAYSAMELTCGQGDVLTGLRSLHGWTWCEDAAGRAGWVPPRNLTPA